MVDLQLHSDVHSGKGKFGSWNNGLLVHGARKWIERMVANASQLTVYTYVHKPVQDITAQFLQTEISWASNCIKLFKIETSILS